MYFDELPLGANASLDAAPTDLRATALAAIAKENDLATRASGHYNLGFLDFLTGPAHFLVAFAYFEGARSFALEAGNLLLAARASRKAYQAYFYAFIDEIRSRVGLLERGRWLPKLEFLRTRSLTDVPDNAPDARLIALWTITLTETALINLFLGIGEPDEAQHCRARLGNELTNFSQLVCEIDPNNKTLARRAIQILELAGTTGDYIDKLLAGLYDSSHCHVFPE